MKSKLWLTVVLAVSGLLAPSLYAESTEVYCHFSLVEGEVYLIKPDQDTVVQAIINYPLFPGDIIYTNSQGRCEIQFSNGTLMRMESHTELQITSILSPSLTSNSKITTLALKKGQVYTMSQVYRREIFQIITPLAAIKMATRSTNHVTITEDNQIRVNVIRGKTGILIDRDQKKVKTEFLRAGKSCRIGKQGLAIEETEIPASDFVLWNREINQNFKTLHEGKSRVPPVIYRRSPGIVHFAEKFSTLFGTWEYHDLFGYVWKPADFVFHNQRPFFDANYVEINGELVLVPNQAWGWAPAHLGTWFWSKTDGWIWIPGNAFSPGICSTGLKDVSAGYWWWIWYLVYPQAGGSAAGFISNGTMENGFYHIPEYWIIRIFGNPELYLTYRQHGPKAWRQAYQLIFKENPPVKKPDYRRVPENIRNIIRTLDRIPEIRIRTYLSENRIDGSLGFFPRPVNIIDQRIQPENLPHDVKNIIHGRSAGEAASDIQSSFSKMDWNPDAAWAKKMGVNLVYSLRNNQVACPELGIGSGDLTRRQRMLLRQSADSMGTGSIKFQSPPQSVGSGPAQPPSPIPLTGSISDSGEAIQTNPNGKNQ